MGKPAVRIELTAIERRELEGLVRRHKTGQALARRARIVLAAAEGLENKEIVVRTGSDANTVGKWRRRSQRTAAALLTGVGSLGIPRAPSHRFIAPSRSSRTGSARGRRSGPCRICPRHASSSAHWENTAADEVC